MYLLSVLYLPLPLYLCRALFLVYLLIFALHSLPFSSFSRSSINFIFSLTLMCNPRWFVRKRGHLNSPGLRSPSLFFHFYPSLQLLFFLYIYSCSSRTYVTIFYVFLRRRKETVAPPYYFARSWFSNKCGAFISFLPCPSLPPCTLLILPSFLSDLCRKHIVRFYNYCPTMCPSAVKLLQPPT